MAKLVSSIIYEKIKLRRIFFIILQIALKYSKILEDKIKIITPHDLCENHIFYPK